MRLELIEGKLSRSVPRGLGGSNPTWLLGAGRKGRKDLARSLPSFKVLGVLFLGKSSQLFCLQRRHVGHTNFGTWGLTNSIRAVTVELGVTFSGQSRATSDPAQA